MPRQFHLGQSISIIQTTCILIGAHSQAFYTLINTFPALAMGAPTANQNIITQILNKGKYIYIYFHICKYICIYDQYSTYTTSVIIRHALTSCKTNTSK